MSVVSDGGEDQEDSSSASNITQTQFKTALDEFREKWQKELKNEITDNISSDGDNVLTNTSVSTESVESDESRAEKLFMQGVDYEKRGKVYDALRFYRRAVQIVPDIEFRIYESAKAKVIQHQGSATNSTGYSAAMLDLTSDNQVNDLKDDEDLSNVDLILRFQTDLAKSETFIQRLGYEKGMITTAAHISDLPMEILLCIFRWVVSSQLDIRSLEQCSRVCKGFYLCARDEEIWRLACLKVWGVNTGVLKGSIYSTWREMFIERQRVHFNGCYISKTTYIRYGENSFQDQFYRPVQFIEYYRYMRFFPDGKVLTMTTAEEPAQCVGKLKNINQMRPDILKGHYRLHGDLIIIVLKRNTKSQHHVAQRKNTTGTDHEGIITFYIELKIISTSKKRFCQLQWKHYSIIQVKNKCEISTDFDLTLTKYPPLWFSRVKSYSLESELPLQ